MSSSLCKGSVLVLFFLQTGHISVHTVSCISYLLFMFLYIFFPHFFVWITVKQELQSSPAVQLSAVTDFTQECFHTFAHLTQK